MPSSVGMISSRRRMMYASMSGFFHRRQGGGLGGIEPPGHEAHVAVSGRNGWPGKLVPVGDAVRVDMPLGDDVVVPQQHAVQRAAGGDQILRDSADTILSISASTMGSFTPMEFWLPL